MRNILILCGVTLLAGITALVIYLRKPEHYGQPFQDSLPLSLAELDRTPERYLHRELRITGTIARQCPLSGHWFFLTDTNGQTSPILFEMTQEVPFLPQRPAHEVTVEGELEKHQDGYRFGSYAIEIR